MGLAAGTLILFRIRPTCANLCPLYCQWFPITCNMKMDTVPGNVKFTMHTIFPPPQKPPDIWPVLQLFYAPNASFIHDY